MNKNHPEKTPTTKNNSNQKPFFKKAWFWVIIVIVLGIAVASGNKGNESTTSDNGTTPAAPTISKPTEKYPDATQEQKNALKKAESYASTMHMSKQGVYGQLTSEYGEGFSAEDAKWAIDHLDGIDWNANALSKAKSYYESMHMSASKVYDQLTSEYGEKFTAAEAQYAIDHLND